MTRLLLLGLLILGSASWLPAADPLAFRDGDRVVLLGSTLIEREQKFGSWELALTLHNQNKNVTFRNLGWSGDNVWGEARNGFDGNPKGFERLVNMTKECKPTVILICYGQTESFDGPAGIAKFTAGLDKLLDAIAPTQARLVLLSPTPLVNIRQFHDANRRNDDLGRYRDAIAATAEKRKLEFIDLFAKTQAAIQADPSLAGTLTSNGIHLTPTGYALTAKLLAPPDSLAQPPTDALRAKIIEKNELFFHRWRPQNETYLFLFRKHEQGNNAKDIPEFDPLIAEAEKQIREMKLTIKN